MSNHEDAIVHHLELFYRSCHDLFIPSCDQDSYLPTVDLSKPLIFDDPSSDELETPQVVEALQPKLMVMLGSCHLEVSSSSDKKYIKSLQNPHHSVFYIEN